MNWFFINFFPNLKNDIFLINSKYFLIKYLFLLTIISSIFWLIKLIQNKIKLKNINKQIINIKNQLKNEYQTKLNKLNWKEFIKLFINFLENFVIEWEYNSIDEILKLIWINQSISKQIQKIIYDDEIELNEVENTVLILKDFLK